MNKLIKIGTTYGGGSTTCNYPIAANVLKDVVYGGGTGTFECPVSPMFPDGWDSGWMLPPTYDETLVNDKTDICGLVCNVLDIGNRNYFSCIASGAYTVNVYTDATATTLISTQNVATGVQANWQIDYALCTHQLNTHTRQAWVEIVPQSGQTLTSFRLNTNHPAETAASTSPYIIWAIVRAPYLTTASQLFRSLGLLEGFNHGNHNVLNSLNGAYYGSTGIRHVTHGNYPLMTTALDMHTINYSLVSVRHKPYPILTNAPGMHLGNTSLVSAYFEGLSAVTNAGSMFGSTTESTCCVSLKKLITIGLGTAFPAATTFILRYTAMQATEANAWVSSLGSTTNAVVFDLRNNPFSADAAFNIAALLAKFPNAAILLV